MNGKKYKWKKIISVIMAVSFVVLLCPTSVKADVYWPEGPSINTPSAILMDVNSGAVLYEKNSHDVNYPASITKVLTTMLVLEYCTMDEIVTFSDDAINLNQGDTSHIARDYGEEMTIEQCLYAVMLESANECSYAVAEHVGNKLGGDYRTFIDLMNQKAEELGCQNTHFNNSNGLPDSEHWTSAYDMALIGAAAYQNEDFREIVSARSYRISPTNKHTEVTPLNNHHAMFSNYKTTEYLYEYCTGGKTGFTQAAGYTLITFAEKDGLSLVCVVMNTNASDRYLDTRTLFEFGFQNFQACSLEENTEIGIENKDKGIMNNHGAFVGIDTDAYITLPVTASVSDVETSTESSNLSGDTVAQLLYSYGGHMVGKVNVVPLHPVVEDNYFDIKKSITDADVIEITPSILIGMIILISLLIIGIIAGKHIYDNYYLYRHNYTTRKQQKSKFKPIRKKSKRRWKKRDRMFK